MRIASILRGDAELSAHGSKEMPVWGLCSSRSAVDTKAKFSKELAILRRTLRLSK